jgi:CheY-like chemotaxis protein
MRRHELEVLHLTYGLEYVTKGLDPASGLPETVNLRFELGIHRPVILPVCSCRLINYFTQSGQIMPDRFGDIPHTKSRPKNPTVLCVDDSPEMLRLLVEILEPEFTIIGTLSCASLAIEKARELQPDIILLDIDLGDTNGFSLAGELRSAGCQAKIVFLSVHESIEFTMAAQALGAAGYVFKSQIPGALTKTLQSLVS